MSSHYSVSLGQCCPFWGANVPETSRCLLYRKGIHSFFPIHNDRCCDRAIVNHEGTSFYITVTDKRVIIGRHELLFSSPDKDLTWSRWVAESSQIRRSVPEVCWMHRSTTNCARIGWLVNTKSEQVSGWRFHTNTLRQKKPIHPPTPHTHQISPPVRSSHTQGWVCSDMHVVNWFTSNTRRYQSHTPCVLEQRNQRTLDTTHAMLSQDKRKFFPGNAFRPQRCRGQIRRPQHISWCLLGFHLTPEIYRMSFELGQWRWFDSGRPREAVTHGTTGVWGCHLWRADVQLVHEKTEADIFCGFFSCCIVFQAQLFLADFSSTDRDFGVQTCISGGFCCDVMRKPIPLPSMCVEMN